jgi:hypothetical protein
MRVLIIPINREQLELRRLELAKNGIILTGDSGSFEALGVEISYFYDDANTLTLTVGKKPVLMPWGPLLQQIKEWFGETG